MPERRTLELSPQERGELIRSRDREPRAYLREQAAALLKIADGQSPHSVARHGLLRCRDPDTVYGWLDYYEEHRKLRVRPSCRRRFPPEDPECKALQERLHQAPERSAPADAQLLPPCWSLALVRMLCPETCDLTTDSGVWRRMQRWRIGWKAGRLHLISPDPDYTPKLEAIAAARARAAAEPTRVRVVYVDEVTFYRRPERGRNWHLRGGGGTAQPTVNQAPGANTKRRVIGALDTVDGRVCSMTRSVIGVRALRAFLRQLRRQYGPDVELVVVWDNWPPHHHKDVVAEAAELKILLLYTPTYAPWTNPIEKLWDKLKDEVLRLHRLSDAWGELRKRVDCFLTQLCQPNLALLRHVGLLPG